MVGETLVCVCVWSGLILTQSLSHTSSLQYYGLSEHFNVTFEDTLLQIHTVCCYIHSYYSIITTLN